MIYNLVISLIMFLKDMSPTGQLISKIKLKEVKGQLWLNFKLIYKI